VYYKDVKLTYQTGIATLVQFITLSFLGIANGLNSIVTTCRHDSHDCINNVIVSIIFFMLTALWFAAVWILGAAAQERRSKRLALALVGAELLIAMVAYFNARHHTDALSLATSLIDLALAFWIIFLALRIIRSKGERIRTGARSRQRRRRPTAV
jgi:drug/metabolite transporter (DMT)-like permease